MTRRIRPRDGDPRLSNDAVLLVRANEDSNPVMGLRRALADAPLYADLPEFAPSGAIMLSTYLAPTVEVAATMIASTQWEWFGTARLGAVRDRGFEVHATTCEVWDELPVCGFPRTRSRVTMRTSWSASIPRINRATTIVRRRQCGSSCAPDLTIGIRRLSRCSTRDSDSRRRTFRPSE